MGFSKDCPRCGKTKWWYEFSRNKKSPSTLNYTCKICDRKRAIIYRNANVERLKLKSANWKKNNRDKVNKWNRENYKQMPHKYAARSLKWRKANPEKVAQIRKNDLDNGNNREIHSICSKYHLSRKEVREAITIANAGARTTQQVINN